MRLISIEDPDARWDKFISQYSHLIFHTSIWAKILKNSYNTNLAYYVLEDNGEWLLAIPGMLIGRFLKLWYSLIPYGGFVGKREYIPAFLELVIKDVKRYRIDRLQIVDPQVDRADKIPELMNRESYQHILDLKGKTEGDVWKGYRPNLRRTIREALDARVLVEKVRDKKEVETFYNLYLASMRRKKGIIHYPFKLFTEMFPLIKQEKADIFLAKHDGKTIAGITMVYSERVAHYFHGGSLTDYLHFRPNDLLFHTAIKKALKKGKAKFDFLGSSKEMKGLIQFKEKWGTERISLFSLHKDITRIKVLLHKLLTPFLRMSQKL